VGDSGRHRTPKTCPCGHIFGVPEGGEEGGRRRTLKTRPCGAFVVFNTSGRAENVSRGMCQTPKTCPQGHVRGVRHKGNGRECAEHQKHAHKGMFVAFDTRGRGVGKGGAVSDTPDAKNTTPGLCSSRLGW